MKNETKLAVALGVGCALLAGVSSCYTILFNDARWIVPMEFSEYVFRVQDLPMLISGALLACYIVYMAAWLIRRAGAAKKRGEAALRFTRTVDPRLGFLGLFGFTGFLGFWTYSVDKTIFPFGFFMFFGFFGFFYEGRMTHVFMDERYLENKLKAQNTAGRISLSIIFIAMLLLGQGRLMGSLEYTLIAFMIVVALAIALQMFLREYLLYHYDNDEPTDKSEE